MADDKLGTQSYMQTTSCRTHTSLYRLLMSNNRFHKESHMLPDSGPRQLPEEAANLDRHGSRSEEGADPNMAGAASGTGGPK